MTGWDGKGIDPFLPTRIARELDTAAAERRIYRAWWASMSDWLVRAHRAVFALGEEEPDPNAIWSQVPEWAEQMEQLTQGPIRDTVGLTYQKLFGEGYLFDTRPAVTTYLAEARNRLVRTPDHVYDIVASQIARASAAGESVPTIADRVSKVLTSTGTENWRGRAVTVARTEALGARSAGRADAHAAVAEALGGEFENVWLSTLDSRVRFDHRLADGQRVPIGTPFTVGGEHLMRPGDPAGSAAQTVQCRCDLLLERVGETTDQTGRGFTDADDWWAKQVAEAGPPLPSRDAPSLATMLDEETAAGGIRKVDKAKIGQWVDGTYAGLDVKVTSVTAVGRRLTFDGKIIDPATGRAIGKFARRIDRDSDGKLYARHDLLQIGRKYQGSGFQAAFNGNLIDWYKRSGVSYVKVGADIDIGGYTWARAGYDFADTNSALGLFGGLQNRLARMHGRPIRQLRWLDDDREVPAWQWDGPVVLPAESPWTQAQLRKAFKGASDAEIARQLKIGQDFVDSLEGKTFGHDLPSAYELSQLGRWPGAGKDDVWIGKLDMLGSSWWGVLRL